jgi:MinD superfamily P-loop ATPase
MRIGVASGKGGTGKTTVATNLALSVGAEVQLLDCDVEEPNAHFFIDPSFEETKTVFTPFLKLMRKNAHFVANAAKYASSTPSRW